MSPRLGVGLIGCGAAAQAIHLPTLASLPELFEIVACMDPDPVVAGGVAGRLGAQHTTELDALLSDPRVEVVVICSPSSAHAAQAIAACDAGKRAVLCEKPLAESVQEAEEIAAASARTGVPVIVATYQRYDPAFRALEDRWGDLPSRASIVRSTINVMPNHELVALATEAVLPDGWSPPGPLPTSPQMDLLMFRGLVTGLFIHHAPLVRMALPTVDAVEIAQPLATSGYLAMVRTEDRVGQLSGMLYRFPHTEWTFELWAEDMQASIEYPAGYLASQSATARLYTRTGAMLHEEVFSSAYETGYRAQWRHVADVVHGDAEPLTPAGQARDDVALACRIAEHAERLSR